MKILDAGHVPLSNADVLEWTRLKRAQHVREDVDDKARGVPTAKRPANFMRVLTRVERELGASRHPYALNSSVYGGEQRGEAFRSFALAVEKEVLDHADVEWREKLQTQSAKQPEKSVNGTAAAIVARQEKEYAEMQERKCLSKMELLTVFNHAPTCVEMLQPMIEQVEERFSAEEQQIIVDVCVRTLRKDQPELLAVEGDG